MNTNNITFDNNIYSLKRDDTIFKKISFNDIFCISKTRRLKYLMCAIKNQHKYLVANNTNNDSSIVCIGYKKTKHDKCNKCCKCYCNNSVLRKNNFDNNIDDFSCSSLQCNYNSKQDCDCVCNCNKICSQFAISETFVINENINDTVNRAINEELNMNFHNANVVIDNNLYTYNDSVSGTIHNAYVHINYDSDFALSKSHSFVNQLDDKKHKALITIYG